MKDKIPKNKNVIWVGDLGLSMALICKNHKTHKTFYDMFTKKLEWLYVDTPRLRADIEKYHAGKLMVRAKTHSLLLTGKF